MWCVTEYTVGDLSREVASILRGLMARYEISQTEMADATGVSQSQLSKMLRARRPIDIDQLVALCQAIGLDASEVLSEAEKVIEGTNKQFLAKRTFVERGLKLDKPYDWTRNVTLIRKDAPTAAEQAPVDLSTVPLEVEKLAASTDNTPVPPDRGQG